MCASELRAKARESLKGSYWPAVLAALIAGFFGALLAGSFGISINVDQEALEFFFPKTAAVLLMIITALGVVTSAFGLVRLILGGVIQLGYAQYLLKQHDREVTDIRDLFSQFDRFGQGFLQKFLCGLFVALWSLLLVIPGIIKGYAYAMTPFIMAENPQMTARDAIKRSQELMDGHKWELFCLEFSFIGWNLLAVLTLGIGTFFLNPYMNAAYAAFYREKISPKVTVEVLTEEIPQLEN